MLIWHQICSYGHFAHLLICSFCVFCNKVFTHFLKWVEMFVHLFILLICSFTHFTHLKKIVLGVPWAWYTQVYYKYSRFLCFFFLSFPLLMTTKHVIHLKSIPNIRNYNYFLFSSFPFYYFLFLSFSFLYWKKIPNTKLLNFHYMSLINFLLTIYSCTFQNLYKKKLT